MKYFVRIFVGCAICFLCVMAGLQFAKGNVGIGILDLALAAMNFSYLVLDD